MSELLRAGDADREATAAVIRRAHEEGRLDTTELEERLERCYGAKTVSELDSIVVDLPHPRRRSSQTRARSRPQPYVLLPLALVVLVVVLATTTRTFFLFPLLFFVVMRFAWRRPRWR